MWWHTAQDDTLGWASLVKTQSLVHHQIYPHLSIFVTNVESFQYTLSSIYIYHLTKRFLLAKSPWFLI